MAAFIRAMRFRFVMAVEPRAVSAIKRSPDVVFNRHVRALRRKPVRVLYPEDETEKVLKPKRSKASVGNCKTQLPVRESEKNRAAASESTVTAGEACRKPAPGVGSSTSHRKARTEARDCGESLGLPDGLRYEKAYAGDKRLAKAVGVARSKKYRQQQGKIVLEGQRLICDALRAGVLPQMVFFSSVEQLRQLPLERLRRAALIKVKLEDIHTWSDLVTPQGIMAIFSRPDASRLAFPDDRRSHAVPLHLICDNVRDPGNLGTILRSAAAAGCQGVLLTKGCVDVWEPKVLRAAMGAHFRIPIIPSLDWSDIPQHLPAGVTVHVADTCSASGCHQGGMGKAVQPNIQLSRKAVDYGWVRSQSNTRAVAHKESPADRDSDSDENDEEGEGGPRVSFPTVEAQVYYEKWAEQHTALVIGGETHGLSLEALLLAEETDGRRLFVPMVPGMDSLNSAMAASVLVFEGKRQMTQQHHFT